MMGSAVHYASREFTRRRSAGEFSSSRQLTAAVLKRCGTQRIATFAVLVGKLYVPLSTARNVTVPRCFSVGVNEYDSLSWPFTRSRCQVPTHWYCPCAPSTCSRAQAGWAPLSSPTETVSRNACPACAARGPEKSSLTFAKAASRR